MRLSQMIGQRLREAPRDAQTISHKFLARGGYCLPVSAGIFTLMPMGHRIARKIEQIIREEMDAIGGQEMLMPVALSAELWQQSGRWESVGSELLRFKDRNGKDMMLGMTHEEACVHAVRANVSSYKQLPLMVYQIQTKYRDEARPRAGLIRTREFTMKDAYSFHVNQEDLERYYKICHAAYTRIFKRIGFKNFISIQADSGIFGGNRSDEFMAIADCGEDTLFVSPNGNYQANREVACANLTYVKEEPAALEKIETPHCKTIADLAKFLGIDEAHTCKAVFYKDSQGKLVFVNIRGDLEVNETKLAKVVKDGNLSFADDALIRSVGAVPGYASSSILPSQTPPIWQSAPIRSSSTTRTSTTTAMSPTRRMSSSQTSHAFATAILRLLTARRSNCCTALKSATSSSSEQSIPCQWDATSLTSTANRSR
ncbi:MAG: proline--tRNA ligase [Lentisphaeria bacterium]|nr:proline--tRNA ligase [Lentisphaeria bacterium]